MISEPGLPHQPERRGSNRIVAATVLVVDDSGATRRILRRELEKAGYRVAEAADGMAALDTCRLISPDLVLLDIDMPVMDGPSALAAMRADDDLAEIPVLFLTARTSGPDVAAGLRLGAQDYLRKPCDPAELAARVATALSQRGRHEHLREQAEQADRDSAVDALTGLANRRRFQREIDELRATLGGSTPIGLVMIDIDHFKQVNDTEGHLVGDVVLRIAARRLLAAVDPQNLVVRWGGEEFVVLAAPPADSPIEDLAERLRNVICSSPFGIGDEQALQVTVSVGCVSGPLEGLEAIVRLADEALYDAKRGGRNRVVSRVA
jgi:two-component system cell cycle response regulator